jgi:nucleolar pre-ribosomal-associated protein 1
VPSAGANVGPLANLLQGWSFAAVSKNEGLFSNITAVLALLLKATSSHIEFRDYGNDLCKTILHEDHIHLLERGLDSTKLKDHVISPCIRLLTEIVLYDGGAAAKTLFARREITFKRLEVFLLMRHESANLTFEGRQKPSVRKNALRYLLANLELQDEVGKSYLITQGKIIRAVFQDIKEDSPSVINEILGTFKRYVVLDQTLLWATKSQLFTSWTLTRIAMLYDYQEKNDGADQPMNIRELAHSFLLSICTDADHGILVTQNEAFLSDNLDMEEAPVWLNDLELQLATKKSQRHKPVKNATLASFLQSLRPYANVMQNELVISIFQAAPELVADYFSKKKSLYFEPKLTATWVGYSMFLLSTIQLPIDGKYLRALSRGYNHVPPPVYVLMESILPSPLTFKALTRCLTQSTVLITFFAIRILIAAFEKLEETLELLRATSQNFEGEALYLWKRTIVKLTSEFGRRCPDMSHLIKTFRCCSKENHLLKDVSTRLLATYYQVLPHIALKEKFDISAAISVAFNDHNYIFRSPNSINTRALERLNILKIACCSPDMRWWHKIGM